MAARAENEIHDAQREWYTSSELAEMNLPGMPSNRRAINALAKDANWAGRCDAQGKALSRRRAARGGGMEYHESVLPEAARSELKLRSAAANENASGNGGLWSWYEAQTGKVKAVAEKRLEMVLAAQGLIEIGRNRTTAIDEIAGKYSVTPATVWNYFKAIRGVPRSDWLASLAPRRKGGGAEADIHPDLWQYFLSSVLQLSEPTFAICYERTAEIAEDRGLPIPSLRTMTRRLDKEVHPAIVKLRRKGKKALSRSLPAQRRSVEHFHAMEWVNIDGHKLDVWVESRDEKDKDGKPKKIRPILLGIQDIRSSKMLAWRVCEVESAHYVRLVFGDLFEKFGFPLHCTLDNGRGFSSKWITGHAAFRFRNKVKAEEPVGLLIKMGIQTHWALPYHGQAKPIERAWKDLTDRVSRHPFCAGAYTGPNPTQKPEDAGTRAIPWDQMVEHVDRQIAKHNAKLGRKGRDYRGRSFDDVFAESYASAPIVKAASPEQLRYAMLAAEQKRLNSQTGELNLFGTRYYSDECARYHGKKVTVRFDPDNLTKEVHLYDQDDAYLCSAAPWGDVAYNDAEAARRTAKWVSEKRREVRQGAEALDLLSARELAALEVGAPEFKVPKEGATRILRTHGSAALKAIPAEAVQPSRIFAALGKPKLVE